MCSYNSEGSKISEWIYSINQLVVGAPAEKLMGL